MKTLEELLQGKNPVDFLRNSPSGPNVYQCVPCSYDGHVIGDVILFNSAPDKYILVGRIPALNWITYHAQAGKHDVKLELDERSAARKDPFGRKQYRFQIQGPNAMKTGAVDFI